MSNLQDVRNASIGSVSAFESPQPAWKVVLKKEYGLAKDIKPGMKIKRPARRQPMPKARASTQMPENPDPKETVDESKKRKERVKKTMARVIGKPSMM